MNILRFNLTCSRVTFRTTRSSGFWLCVLYFYFNKFNFLFTVLDCLHFSLASFFLYFSHKQSTLSTRTNPIKRQEKKLRNKQLYLFFIQIISICKIFIYNSMIKLQRASQSNGMRLEYFYVFESLVVLQHEHIQEIAYDYLTYKTFCSLYHVLT